MVSRQRRSARCFDASVLSYLPFPAFWKAAWTTTSGYRAHTRSHITSHNMLTSNSGHTRGRGCPSGTSRLAIGDETRYKSQEVLHACTPNTPRSLLTSCRFVERPFLASFLDQVSVGIPFLHFPLNSRILSLYSEPGSPFDFFLPDYLT